MQRGGVTLRCILPPHWAAVQITAHAAFVIGWPSVSWNELAAHA
jgi:hypothetical protein